ncbi:hypothetical protein [Microbacterium sp. G2-8]|uniref:hypothetical protein n=1 Tax=Microbacterium sp. G2-8 TaxID=2842454 RepID=UPI001C89B3D1|nr:hypothetical protein [Microbacterium sp. G2-8]
MATLSGRTKVTISLIPLAAWVVFLGVLIGIQSQHEGTQMCEFGPDGGRCVTE